MIKLVTQEHGQQPKVIGEIDGASLSYQANRATLDVRDGHALTALLAPDWTSYVFHMHLEDGTLLLDCKIRQSGGPDLRGGVDIRFAGTSKV